MKKDYSKNHEKDYQALYEKYEASKLENKELKELIRDLKAIAASTIEIKESLKELKEANKEKDETIKELTNKVGELMNQNKKLLDEIERLKNNNKKDSSNSSKPSSTNGSKRIPNSREKSSRKVGGQANHIAHTLKAKDIEAIIKDKENVEYVKETISEINKKCPKYVIDLCVKLLVTENNSENIDKLNDVQYGDTIKSIVVLLATDCYMSYDNIIKFISALTNNKINLSKGTLVNWIENFSNKLDDEIKVIENNLLDGYYINADDSQIKINGENYNQLCLCNPKSVMLYNSKNKNRKAWENTIITKYVGVIVKDGTKVFNNLNNSKSQCIAHIIRYLKGAYEFSDNKHRTPKKLLEFLKCINNYRNTLISKNIIGFTAEELTRYTDRYDELIKEWEKELENESKTIYKDEINLFERMRENDRDEILYFMKDFNIPFTNNNAESSQRGVKVKQKIGKFRTEKGAKSYFKVKSFILTLKKRKYSLFESINKIISGYPVLAK